MQLLRFSLLRQNGSSGKKENFLSIASEINRIKNNIEQAYVSLENSGASVPQARNSSNLADAVDSLASFRDTVMIRAFLSDDTDPVPDGQLYKCDDEVLLKTQSSAIKLADEIPTYVSSAVEALAKRVESRQNPDTISLIAASDFHLDLSNSAVAASHRHMIQAIGLLSKRIKVDFIAGLGDYTWCMSRNTDREEGSEEIRTVIRNLRDSVGNVPLFLTVGNHDPLTDARTDNGDGTYSDYAENNYLDPDTLFPMIGIYNPYVSISPCGYGYRDYPDRKLRVIFLNTSDSDCNINPDAYTDNTYIGDIGAQQAQWFADSLDLSAKDDSSDWKILIMSHHPLDWERLIPVVKILKAYEDGATGTFVYTYGRGHLQANITYDYNAKNSAKIIGQIHGHLHNFRVDSLHYLDDLQQPQAISAKRVSVPNACFLRTNHVEGGGTGSIISNGIEFGVPADGDLYKKVADTAEDTAFSVITIDLAKEIMYIDNYGAGYDRTMDYYVAPDLENLAASATDGVRLNSSGTTTANQYQTTSDYISVSEGDSILFGGSDWYDKASQSIYCSIYLYDNSKGKITGVGATAYPDPRKFDSRLREIPITSEVFANVTWANVAYCRISLVGSSEEMSLYHYAAEPDTPDYMRTNLVPEATDDNGDILNGTGYIDGYRLSSAGTTASMKASTGCTTTGFIPVSSGDTLHIGGGEWISKVIDNKLTYGYVYLYDASKTPIGFIATDDNSSLPALDLDNYGLYSVALNNTTQWKSAPADYSQIAYCRITLVGTGNNLVVYRETLGS